MSGCQPAGDEPSPLVITHSPFFSSNVGWSAGYEIATRDGNGAVVGPGGANPNVFAQQFGTEAGSQYIIQACAASVDSGISTAVIQVNWTSGTGQYIGISRTTMKVGETPREFSLIVEAPYQATAGTLYVVPGEANSQIRYTEMSATKLDPIENFATYKFWGVEGVYLPCVAIFLAIMGWFLHKLVRRNFEFGRRLALTIGNRNSLANTSIQFGFFALAGLLVATVLLVLEPAYEQHYDAAWHQTSVNSIFTWSTFSLDLKADILHNFGIQLPINPFLSPTFLLGSLVDMDVRISYQGAFQAVIMFLLLVKIARLAGARVADANAASLIAILYCWVPIMSDEAVSHQATLGLLWQDIAIAVLLATLTFSVIGDPSFTKRQHLWSGIGFSSVVLWAYFAYPELTPFFTLATAFLCVGIAVSIRTWSELQNKVTISLCLIGFMLLIGMHEFILNLFAYTPQSYFEGLQHTAVVSHYFRVNSLLANAQSVGGFKLYLFFFLAVIGGGVAYQFGNAFARRMLYAALTFEAMVVWSAAANAYWEVIPLAFTYVEVAGIALVALFAGIGLWSIVRAFFAGVGFALASVWDRFAGHQNSAQTLMRSEWEAIASLIAVLVGVVWLVRLVSATEGYQSGYPASMASEPAQIIRQNMAVQPGDPFLGRGLLLVNMEADGTARWWDNFLIRYFEYRRNLGNDLSNDLTQANIPSVNEYGHWASPGMTSLMAVAFYRPDDTLERAARVLREFRPNLARLLGVSIVVADAPLSGMVELYQGKAGNHPLYVYSLEGTNLGQFSPTQMHLARNATEAVEQLRLPEFDGRAVAVVEESIQEQLVEARQVAVTLEEGPRLHVEATTEGTSLVVLPFEFSYCLELSGDDSSRIFPVNLSQTGLLFQGEVSIDIEYRYGLFAGTSCRQTDLERIRQLNVSDAVEGRLVLDPARL